jgi:hypothetical protein
MLDVMITELYNLNISEKLACSLAKPRKGLIWGIKREHDGNGHRNLA